MAGHNQRGGVVVRIRGGNVNVIAAPGHGIDVVPFRNRRVLRLGDRAAGGQAWRVGPPFGHELIVAIASSKPLFPAPRPATETTQDYIAALSEALVIANEAGGQPPVASALVITTLPK